MDDPLAPQIETIPEGTEYKLSRNCIVLMDDGYMVLFQKYDIVEGEKVLDGVECVEKSDFNKIATKI